MLKQTFWFDKTVKRNRKKQAIQFGLQQTNDRHSLELYYMHDAKSARGEREKEIGENQLDLWFEQQQRKSHTVRLLELKCA